MNFLAGFSDGLFKHADAKTEALKAMSEALRGEAMQGALTYGTLGGLGGALGGAAATPEDRLGGALRGGLAGALLGGTGGAVAGRLGPGSKRLEEATAGLRGLEGQSAGRIRQGMEAIPEAEMAEMARRLKGSGPVSPSLSVDALSDAALTVPGLAALVGGGAGGYKSQENVPSEAEMYQIPPHIRAMHMQRAMGKQGAANAMLPTTPYSPLFQLTTSF